MCIYIKICREESCQIKITPYKIPKGNMKPLFFSLLSPHTSSFKQSYSKAFLASNEENNLLNFEDSTKVPGSSLTNKDPVTWTRGEVLGKGAYGTVS